MSEKKVDLKKAAYTAVQWTWGLPQTLIGAALFLKHRKDPHFDYNGACATAWDSDAGVSLGKFIFVPAKKSCQNQQDKKIFADRPGSGVKHAVKSNYAKSDVKLPVDEFLLSHEYGHTIQSLLLGPAYLLIVGVPSLAWNRIPYFARKRKEKGKSYYSAVFERTANSLGNRSKKN